MQSVSSREIDGTLKADRSQIGLLLTCRSEQKHEGLKEDSHLRSFFVVFQMERLTRPQKKGGTHSC